MTEILPSRSGLVHFSQVKPLSPHFCPHTSSSIGVGCHAGDVEEGASVHLYHNHSASGSYSQGMPGRSMPATVALFGSAPVWFLDLVSLLKGSPWEILTRRGEKKYNQ